MSYDGHAFSTGAYATDFVEKMWPANYGRREGLYLSEGGYKLRNPFGNIAAPPQGYIWDFAKRAGVSRAQLRRVRGAGGRPGGEVEASVPGPRRARPSVVSAVRHEHPRRQAHRGLARGVPRVRAERHGAAAVDHPAAARSHERHHARRGHAARHGRRQRPRARAVRRDDFAQPLSGRSRRSSSSKTMRRTGRTTWTRTARSCSRSARSRRRGVVDSTLYTTSGVLRTMELILGLPPMSQYDAAATPMYNAFQTTPSLAPFTHLPARVPLDLKNDWTPPGRRPRCG